MLLKSEGAGRRQWCVCVIVMSWDEQYKGYVILRSVVFNIDVFVSSYVTEHGNKLTLKVSMGSLFTDVRLRHFALSKKNDISSA